MKVSSQGTKVNDGCSSCPCCADNLCPTTVQLEINNYLKRSSDFKIVNKYLIHGFVDTKIWKEFCIYLRSFNNQTKLAQSLQKIYP